MLGDAGIVLDGDGLGRLWRFHGLIRSHNDDNDLTRLRSFRDFVVKHYIDCLVVPSLIRLPSPLLDIGTGAGFPEYRSRSECRNAMSYCPRADRNELIFSKWR